LPFDRPGPHFAQIWPLSQRFLNGGLSICFHATIEFAKGRTLVMDANGILTLLSAHLLLIEAAPCLVLALGLALGLARLHRLAVARAGGAEATNETLRDELWRLNVPKRPARPNPAFWRR
jgi:hypothetical protein